MNERDCSTCKNYEPREKAVSPFPQGVKTEDIVAGMLMRSGGDNTSSDFYLAMETPESGAGSMRATSISKGKEPKVFRLSLAHWGCQPYERGGSYDNHRWLMEVLVNTLPEG